MCFSASASLTASAVLIPIGILCIRTVLDVNSSESLLHRREFLAISCVPLFFGIQQAFEGVLWLEINANHAVETSFAALGFLFFSHFLWLAWMPFSAFAVEPDPQKQKILLSLTSIGCLYGFFLYVPLLLNPNWIEISVIHHSIDYKIRLILDFVLQGQQVVGIYVFLILFPLLLSSLRRMNVFGILIGISASLTYLSFSYAFISVWCFFAALLSVYVFYMVNRENEPISDKWMV